MLRTIDFDRRGGAVAVDWFDGNEELTEYEYLPGGKKCYFPRVQPPKKGFRASSRSPSRSPQRSPSRSPPPPQSQGTAFAITMAELGQATQPSAPKHNTDLEHHDDTDLELPPLQPPPSFSSLADDQNQQQQEQKRQTQQQKQEQQEQTRGRSRSPSLLAKRLGGRSSPTGGRKSLSPVEKLGHVMRTLKVSTSSAAKGTLLLSGPKWMVTRQTIRCFAPPDYFNAAAVLHDEKSRLLEREPLIVDVDEFNPVTRNHVVTILRQDGRSSGTGQAPYAAGGEKVGSYVTLKLANTPHQADLSRPLTLYQSWQMKFDSTPHVEASSIAALKRRLLRDLVWSDESLKSGAYFTLVFGGDEGEEEGTALKRTAAAEEEKDGENKSESSDSDSASSDDSSSNGVSKSRMASWFFELPNPWWNEAEEIINTAKQEYIDRWNRIHEVNKEKRRQQLAAAGKREEAATIAKWKDDNPTFTYVELSEQRKRAAALAAVYMEQWAAEHPPPTAVELDIRDKEAEAAAKDAVTVHFVKNLPDAPEINVAIEIDANDNRVIASGAILSSVVSGPTLKVQLEPLDAASLYFEAAWNEDKKKWVDPPSKVMIKRQHEVRFPRDGDIAWDEFLANSLAPEVQSRMRALPPIFAYQCGQRIRDIEEIDHACAFATIVDYDGNHHSPYEIRVDNLDENPENDDDEAAESVYRLNPTEHNHRPAESYKYERGTQLSVYLDGTWCDLVQKAERSSERALLVVEAIRGDPGRHFDLNNTNHAVRRLSADDFDVARAAYLYCLAHDERSVFDIITGAKLDVKKQDIRLRSAFAHEPEPRPAVASPESQNHVIQAVKRKLVSGGLLSGMAAQWRDAASRKVAEKEMQKTMAEKVVPAHEVTKAKRKKLWKEKFLSVSTVDDLVQILASPSDARLHGNVQEMCVLLRGTPGAGKSWAVSQIAVRLAELASDAEKQEWIPVIIRARELASLLRKNISSEHLPPPKSFHLIHWFLQNSPRFSPNTQGRTAHTRQMLLQAFDSMRLIIIVDGLDEIADDIRENLEHFLLAELVPNKMRLLITARPGARTKQDEGVAATIPVMVRQSHTGFVQGPRTSRAQKTYRDKSTFEDKPYFTVFDLDPIKDDQRSAVINQQIPAHEEFFSSLQKYNTNRAQMDAIYVSACPTGTLEQIASRPVPSSVEQSAPGGWDASSSDRNWNVKELYKHAPEAKELLHIELTRIMFNLGLSTTFLITLPLKGQVFDDESWMDNEGDDDDPDKQRKRLRKMKLLEKKACEAVDIDYTAVRRMCRSNGRRQDHPESGGAALVFNVVQEMALLETESQLEAVFRRLEEGTKSLQLVGVSNFFEPSNIDLTRFRRLELIVNLTLKEGQSYLCGIELHIGPIFDKTSNGPCGYFERLMKRSAEEAEATTVDHRSDDASPPVVPALLRGPQTVEELTRDMETRLAAISSFEKDVTLRSLHLSVLSDAICHGRVLPLVKSRLELYRGATAAAVRRVKGLLDGGNLKNKGMNSTFERQSNCDAVLAIIRRIAFANQRSRRTYFTFADIQDAVMEGDYDQRGISAPDDTAKIEELLHRLQEIAVERSCALPFIESVVEYTKEYDGLFRFTEGSLQDYFAAMELLHRLNALDTAPASSKHDYEGVVVYRSERNLGRPSATTRVWDPRDTTTSTSTLNDIYFEPMLQFIAEANVVDGNSVSLSPSASHLTFPNGEYSASGLTMDGLNRLVMLLVRQPCLTNLKLAGSLQIIGELPVQFGEAVQLLRSLDLSNCRHISGNLNFVRQLPALTSLTLSNCVNLDCRDALSQLSSWEPTSSTLKEVNLAGTNVQGELTVPIMAWLTSLEFKNFRACGRLTVPEMFSSHLEGYGIEHIDLYSLSTVDGKLKSFTTLRSLTHLNLSGCQKISGWLHPLVHLTNLRELNLRCCSNVSGMCEALSSVTSLTSLGLCECKALTSFEGLECLTNLRSLDLRSTSICSPLNISGGRFRYDLLAADGETVVHNVDAEKNIRLNPTRYRIVDGGEARPLAPGTRIEKLERTGAKDSRGRNERAWRLNCSVVSHTEDALLSTTEFTHAQCSAGWVPFSGRLLHLTDAAEAEQEADDSSAAAKQFKNAVKQLRDAVVIMKVAELGVDDEDEETFERISRVTSRGARALILVGPSSGSGTLQRRKRRFKIPVIIAHDLPPISDSAVVTFDGGALTRILAKLPGLTNLNLGGCHDLKDEVTAPLVKWLSSIPNKNLKGCGHMHLASDLRSLDGEIARVDLSNLQSLDGTLRSFSFITSLTHLRLQHCEWIRGSVKPLAELKQLEELSIAYCVRLSGSVKPLEACEKLTLLDVRQCKKLTGLSDLQMSGKVPGICHAGGVRS